MNICIHIIVIIMNTWSGETETNTLWLQEFYWDTFNSLQNMCKVMGTYWFSFTPEIVKSNTITIDF